MKDDTTTANIADGLMLASGSFNRNLLILACFGPIGVVASALTSFSRTVAICSSSSSKQ